MHAHLDGSIGSKVGFFDAVSRRRPDLIPSRLPQCSIASGSSRASARGRECSNVLLHGQHRVSALVPTPHHHFPYRVLRTFVHSCSGRPEPPRGFSVSLFLFLSIPPSPLSYARFRSLSLSLPEANPATLLARAVIEHDRATKFASL